MDRGLPQLVDGLVLDRNFDSRRRDIAKTCFLEQRSQRRLVAVIGGRGRAAGTQALPDLVERLHHLDAVDLPHARRDDAARPGYTRELTHRARRVAQEDDDQLRERGIEARVLPRQLLRRRLAHVEPRKPLAKRRRIVGRGLRGRNVLRAQSPDELVGQRAGAGAYIERALRRRDAHEIGELLGERRRVAPHEAVVGVTGTAEDRSAGAHAGVTAAANARAFSSKGPSGLPRSRNSSACACSRCPASSDASHWPAGPTPWPIACQNSSKSP